MRGRSTAVLCVSLRGSLRPVAVARAATGAEHVSVSAVYRAVSVSPAVSVSLCLCCVCYLLSLVVRSPSRVCGQRRRGGGRCRGGGGGDDRDHRQRSPRLATATATAPWHQSPSRLLICFSSSFAVRSFFINRSAAVSVGASMVSQAAATAPGGGSHSAAAVGHRRSGRGRLCRLFGL